MLCTLATFNFWISLERKKLTLFFRLLQVQAERVWLLTIQAIPLSI